jgi:DNA-binding MarR family transcriptional regulator
MKNELAGSLSDAIYELTRISMNRRLNTPFKTSEISAMVFISEQAKKGDTVQPTDIASHFSISKAWVTAILHSLAAGGLITEQQGFRDKRTKTLAMSPKGEAVVAELKEQFIADYLQVVEDMGEEKAGQLLGLIGQTIESLRETHEPDDRRRNSRWIPNI